MLKKIIKAKCFSAGGSELIEAEPLIKDFSLKVHKFTPRQRPQDIRNIFIFPIFSEFGCETIAAVYCLPKILQKTMGKYTVVMGWHGRSYLYKHLVDEFWEVPAEHMWLREYCRAFHHVSRNLSKLEKESSNFGKVIDINMLANLVVFPKLEQCLNKACGSKKILVLREGQKCEICRKRYPAVGFFYRIEEAKKEARWIPSPSEDKLKKARSLLPDKAVGITARYRKTWGRNLDALFYERLIFLLEDFGYNPVWMGEEATTLECPVSHIVDLRGMEDLELTFACVSQMMFTIQFWTASSRLAALMNVPYIIFESPDQIWGAGQEGYRLDLLTRGRRKMVISHYENVKKNPIATMKMIRKVICEIENNNYADLIDLVENIEYVKFLRRAK